MVITIEPAFMEQLQLCPKEFQERFRKAYQQLKIADKPLEIKGITAIVGYKNFFKLLIDKSRIGLDWNGKTLRISNFLFNQFLHLRDED